MKHLNNSQCTFVAGLIRHKKFDDALQILKEIPSSDARNHVLEAFIAAQITKKIFALHLMTTAAELRGRKLTQKELESCIRFYLKGGNFFMAKEAAELRLRSLTPREGRLIILRGRQRGIAAIILEGAKLLPPGPEQKALFEEVIAMHIAAADASAAKELAAKNDRKLTVGEFAQLLTAAIKNGKLETAREIRRASGHQLTRAEIGACLYPSDRVACRDIEVLVKELRSGDDLMALLEKEIAYRSQTGSLEEANMAAKYRGRPLRAAELKQIVVVATDNQRYEIALGAASQLTEDRDRSSAIKSIVALYATNLDRWNDETTNAILKAVNVMENGPIKAKCLDLLLLPVAKTRDTYLLVQTIGKTSKKLTNERVNKLIKMASRFW